MADNLTAAIPLVVPPLVLIASYLMLVREFNHWNLFAVKVHESGKYTLYQTIFYYNHFLRELPIDTLFVFASLWAYGAVGLAIPGSIGQPLAVVLLGIFLVCVFIGSLITVGLRTTLADLLQFRARDEIREWGSHWQMHFLSTLAILLLLILPGTLSPGAAAHYPHLLSLLAGFIGLSLIFKTGVRAVRDTRWILHGAREILTYAVMLALPAFAALPARFGSGDLRWTGWSLVAVMVLLAIAAYSLQTYRRTDLDRQASSDRGIVFLLSSHFFEHTLDYIYILLLMLAIGPRSG